MNTDEGKPDLSSGELGGEAITAPLKQPTVDEQARSVEQPAMETPPPKDRWLEPGFHRLDRRYIIVEILSGSVLTGVASVAGLVAIAITAFAVNERWIWLLIIAGVALFLVWLWSMTLFWPRLEHRHASWKLDELGLEVRKGVLWRHRITVPRARVQHVDVSQGPLQRNFGLAELTIYTAGTQNSSVKLNGLAHSVATDVRNELISKQDPADVV